MAESSAVASLLPENMIQGGLADDFDGVITSATFAPWDYAGKLDHHVLAVHLVIKPDEGDEGDVDAWYSAGDLDSFMPSKDGSTPVDTSDFGQEGVPFEKVEGFFALRVGKKEGLNNNTNFAQFVGAALEAGFPKEKVSADIRFLVGTHAHFNRIQQKKRAGLVKAQPEGQQKRGGEVLVITEFKGFTGGAGAGKSSTSGGGGLKKPSAASTSAPATTTAPSTSTAPTTGDLDTALIAVVSEVIAGQAEGVSKTKLPPAALKSLKPADKGKGVKRITEAAFLESAGDGSDGKPWAFDAESGTLFPLG